MDETKKQDDAICDAEYLDSTYSDTPEGAALTGRILAKAVASKQKQGNLVLVVELNLEDVARVLLGDVNEGYYTEEEIAEGVAVFNEEQTAFDDCEFWNKSLKCLFADYMERVYGAAAEKRESERLAAELSGE